MNEFNTVGMIAVSADEMQQVDGGFGPLIFMAGGLVGIGAVVIGNEIGKSLGGGGEALPGLGQFLAGTTAIATAAGGRPH